MDKRQRRLKAALDRRIKDFEEIQVAIEMSRADGYPSFESVRAGLPGWVLLNKKRSIISQDIYKTAENLGVQDQYEKYLAYFNDSKPKSDIINPNDMRSLETIELQQGIYEDMINGLR